MCKAAVRAGHLEPLPAMCGNLFLTDRSNIFPLLCPVGKSAVRHCLEDVTLFVVAHLGHLAAIHFAVVKLDGRANRPVAEVQDDLLAMFRVLELHSGLESFKGHVN